MLCGVMRIGLVAKGLLIKGDMDLELVLMCRDKPSQILLDSVCNNLPGQIEVRCYALALASAFDETLALKVDAWTTQNRFNIFLDMNSLISLDL